MEIYVGNLSYQTTDLELKELFEDYGTVNAASIIRDRVTGRSKGFGFTNMPNEEEAQKAIEDLDGSEFHGRIIKVNQARPRQEHSRGGSSRY